ncbi:MAG: putative transposase, partial [Candidatus Atribacteria bacterium]|nr:putative transposase [Candidatus Atribacteria bacterium]
NVKRYRGSKMMQRWLASALLDCERRFRRVKGYALIPEVINNIEEAEEENTEAALLVI